MLYRSINVFGVAPRNFIGFSMKSLHEAALMVLVTCFSHVILLSNVSRGSLLILQPAEDLCQSAG